ncbi:MAG: hypothetical protein U1A27_04540 [Phycisphaerae bacterium]
MFVQTNLDLLTLCRTASPVVQPWIDVLNLAIFNPLGFFILDARDYCQTVFDTVNGILQFFGLA